MGSVPLADCEWGSALFHKLNSEITSIRYSLLYFSLKHYSKEVKFRTLHRKQTQNYRVLIALFVDLLTCLDSPQQHSGVLN